MKPLRGESKVNKFGPGYWFAIPLQSGWVVGLIARRNRLGNCLGYFFAPLLSHPPALEQVVHLRADQAFYLHCFGDLRLENGKWIVLGPQPKWEPADWPVPEFRVSEALIGVGPGWRIRRYDDELINCVEERKATESEVLDLPDEGGAGPLWIELRLARLLGTRASELDPYEDRRLPMQPPQHFLYFHDKELAENAAEACRALGYDPRFEPSVIPEKPWLLLVRHKVRVATAEAMEQAARRLGEVAEEWGGEYDGWDKPA